MENIFRPKAACKRDDETEEWARQLRQTQELRSNFDSCANNFAGDCVCGCMRSRFDSLCFPGYVGYSLIWNAFCAFTNLLNALFQLSDFDLFAHIKHKYERRPSSAEAMDAGTLTKAISALIIWVINHALPANVNIINISLRATCSEGGCTINKSKLPGSVL